MKSNKNISNKTKKIKKKKKYGFLKFLLFIVIITILYLGINHICNKIAYNTLNSVAIDYPFTFIDNTNSLWYVTNDFKVPTYYEKENGKKVNIEWISDNTKVVNFVDETAKVTRPIKTSKVVNIEQTYKFLIGKASISYKMNVIPIETLDINSIDVITIEELKNKEYNRDMEAVIDENGQLKYMLGDFKNTFAYSIEDAYTIIQAYKYQFNANENIEFKLDKVNEFDIYRTYKFNCYINDVMLADKYANITVNSETCQVTNISINATAENTNIIINDNLNYEEIIDKYIKENTNENTEYIIVENENIIKDNKQLKVFYCIFENGNSYICYINMSNGNVESFENNLQFFNEEKAKEAQCFSNDAFGNTFEFNASKYKKKYYLYDINRNIHTMDNKGYWDFVNSWTTYGEERGKDFLYWVTTPVTLVQGTVARYMNFEISSENKEFSKWAYAKAYNNMQIAYDWYKSKGLISYDGKGSGITILVDHNQTIDNACWDYTSKLMKIGPVEYFKYPLGTLPDVIAHEYTHAVFKNNLNTSTSQSSLSDSSGKEITGINEAYADVLGCVATNNTSWIIADTYDKDGNHIYIRNLKYINVDKNSEIQPYKGKISSEYYKDDIWLENNGEEHVISTVISRVAYKMWSTGYFTMEEVGDIFYGSMGNSFNSDSNYLACRKFLIKTAKDKGYSAEQIDCIAHEFDLVKVYDASYKFKTDKFNNIDNSEESLINDITIKTEDNSVKGDPVLDNSTEKEFLVAYSLAGIMLGDGNGIYIYEVGNSLSNEDSEKISKELTTRFNEKHDNLNIRDCEITVEYRQIPKFLMDIYKQTCANSNDFMKNVTLDAMGLEEDDAGFENLSIMEQFFKFAFDFIIVESTSYDLYDGLGLLE